MRPEAVARPVTSPQRHAAVMSACRYKLAGSDRHCSCCSSHVSHSEMSWLPTLKAGRIQEREHCLRVSNDPVLQRTNVQVLSEEARPSTVSTAFHLKLQPAASGAEVCSRRNTRLQSVWCTARCLSCGVLKLRKQVPEPLRKVCRSCSRSTGPPAMLGSGQHGCRAVRCRIGVSDRYNGRRAEALAALTPPAPETLYS